MSFPKPFLRRTFLLCAALLLLRPPVGAAPSGAGTDTDTYTHPQSTVVGYYAGWSSYQGYHASDIPAHLLTHINYSFAMIDPDSGTLALDNPSQDEKNFADLRALREEYPHLKLILSVGGWDYSAHFSDVAATAAGRADFAQSCAELLASYDLDGIDLDWEYPVSGGTAGTNHRPQDKQNFTLLLKAIRQELDRQGKRDGKAYQLTIAGAAGEWYLSNIQPTAVAEIVDHIFLMAYDIHGPWDKYADFNAPLYTPSGSAPHHQSSVSGSVEAYLESGVPADKLVLGMPLYGYRYDGVSGSQNGLYSTFTTARSIPYDTLVATYLSDPSYRQLRHVEARVPYLYGKGSFLSYDDPQSMAEKAALARELDLQGIGFWELSQDRGAVLIESAVSQLDGSPFADVSSGAWYAAAVAYVHEQGWMTGTASNLFSPDLSISRSMVATILHRLADSPETEAPSFPDVEAGTWYTQAVAWAAEEGIVLGYDDGRFGPEDPVTREQLAALLYRYAQYQDYDTSGRASLSGYTDAAQISPYARTAMAWAVDTGLLTGRTQTTLVPGGTATRAELAVILERFAVLYLR